MSCVHKLAQQCLAEPHFVLKPELGEKQLVSTKMKRAKLDPVRPPPARRRAPDALGPPSSAVRRPAGVRRARRPPRR